MPKFYRAICVALGFTFLLCQRPAWSQVAREGKTTYSNFDIRDPDLAGNAKSNFRGRTKESCRRSAITNTVNAMNAAKTALAARVPTLQLEMNQWGTAPETIGTSTAKQFLTPESSRMIADTARDFLSEQAALFGLTQDAGECAGSSSRIITIRPATWAGPSIGRKRTASRFFRVKSDLVLLLRARSLA